MARRASMSRFKVLSWEKMKTSLANANQQGDGNTMKLLRFAFPIFVMLSNIQSHALTNASIRVTKSYFMEPEEKESDLTILQYLAVQREWLRGEINQYGNEMDHKVYKLKMQVPRL